MNNDFLTSDAADINALEDFCKLNGIVGFQSGNVSPKVALAMLKKQLKENSKSKKNESKINNKILLLG